MPDLHSIYFRPVTFYKVLKNCNTCSNTCFETRLRATASTSSYLFHFHNTLFYKQQVYKQQQIEIFKENKRKLSNTLKLNFR